MSEWMNGANISFLFPAGCLSGCSDLLWIVPEQPVSIFPPTWFPSLSQPGICPCYCPMDLGSWTLTFEISSWEGFRFLTWAWAGERLGFSDSSVENWQNNISVDGEELGMVVSSVWVLGLIGWARAELPGFKFWLKLCALGQVASPFCASFYSRVKWGQ